MRYLGLDLGITSLGVAISDKTNTLASPFKLIKFARENYDEALEKLLEIIKTEGINTVILGIPKNMDNSLGFAAERSLNFKGLLEKEFGLPIELIDERLTTVAAEKVLLEADLSRKKRKNVIDGVAAAFILESYLKRRDNDGK